jgi:vesicle-fusing ATPase
LAEHQKLLNFNMCKGVILEGPPGTGKTLMARKLGLLLNAHVKIVRGPDILSQYVGNSAKKTRDLFAEAELDWNAYGNKSPLHIILIDEIDAICPKRSYD